MRNVKVMYETPTDFELHLFHEGNLFQAYTLFGAHIIKNREQTSTRFCVWAPHAKRIRVVGSFNHWNGREYEMTRLNREGVWMLTVPQDLTGHLYKYEIESQEGHVFHKTDPFAFYTELRPHTAGIIYNLSGFQWDDEEWLRKRIQKPVYQEPLFIYEVHLGTWKKKHGNDFLTYRELAKELVPYVKQLGFTHIEILPVTEHPFDRSWGYQSTGYFAPTSRYGTPHDLMYFVNECHKHGLGVILDWVPGHFCKDAHGLYRFDGHYLYEYPEERDRENFTWGTANFDLGKNEIHSFLISNAIYWLDYYHIDGFRLDAVSKIIYWPNSHDCTVNPYGISFLQKLNRAVGQYDPHVLMIAEDSTDYPRVTAPVHLDGLGFHYKWNMGWMNDVLTYMELPPAERSSAHSKMTFSLIYAFSENFILPFSHDEVVHGKKSLLNKMPGDYWQKFAQLRLLYGYMVAHPGKKLLFMGGEIGQFDEWKDLEEIDWHLLDYDMHRKMNVYVRNLLAFYKQSKPLYELDHQPEGFEWIDVNNHEQKIFSFIRKAKNKDEFLVVICNFSEYPYHQYKVGVPQKGAYQEIWNSDAEQYGGLGITNPKAVNAQEGVYHGKPYHIEISIPPFSAIFFQPVNSRKECLAHGESRLCRDVVSRRERKSIKRTDKRFGQTSSTVRRKV